MSNVSIHLRDDIKRKLDKLAKRIDRSRSCVVSEAVEALVAHREWMDVEIEKALAKLDAGEARFTPHEEVKAALLARVRTAK